MNINVASEISAFGIAVVNPLTAHTEYDNDSRVIDIITHGFDTKSDNKELNKRCTFYRLVD